MLNDMKINLRTLCFLFISGILLCGFIPAKEKKAELSIRFLPVFNGTPLLLAETAYNTESGDSIFIDQFKCYLSNFELKGERTNFKSHEAFLLDAEDSTSLILQLKDLDEGNYADLVFNIGVDSLANVSGALDGALDPVNGMYWAWNTGYINAKLTGRSPSCRTLHNAFEFHIGGYLPPFKTLKKARLKLDGFTIIPNEINELVILIELSEWFKNPEPIKLSKTNSIVMPDKNAVMMAENYSDMFYLSK